MTFDEWVQYGIDQKWCCPVVCQTHDGVPFTVAEEMAWEDGDDPCVHVIRVVSTPAEHDEAMPTVVPWRKE